MVHSLPLISALCRESVEFVVIGGMAAIVHGSAYLTKDLDICYSRKEANLASLVKALAPFNPQLRGAPAGLPFRFDESTLRSGCNFTFTTTEGDMDILGEVAGLGDYSSVDQHAVSMPVEGYDCRVLTLEALILSKKAAGRRRDLEMVHELEALQVLTRKPSA